jgi:hypothetical protein
VDDTVLGASADSLGRIGAEFEHASDIKDRLVGELGSGSIADAMGDFVGNWDRHRHQVVDQIRKVEGTRDRRWPRSARPTARPAPPCGRRPAARPRRRALDDQAT